MIWHYVVAVLWAASLWGAYAYGKKKAMKMTVAVVDNAINIGKALGKLEAVQKIRDMAARQRSSNDPNIN